MAVQVTIDEEDIEGSLVVGHKDIRFLLVQTLAALHFYWE